MEIVYRAAVVFCFLWVITRAVGRSTLGELSAFELLLFVTMGDLIQQGVTQQDYSLTGSMLAVSTMALFTVAASYVDWRWRKARPVVHGVPVVVVCDGAPAVDAMRGERLSMDDLMAAARENGIERFSDIKLAVLEADGRISFFTKPSAPESAHSGADAGAEVG